MTSVRHLIACDESRRAHNHGEECFAHGRVGWDSNVNQASQITEEQQKSQRTRGMDYLVRLEVIHEGFRFGFPRGRALDFSPGRCPHSLRTSCSGRIGCHRATRDGCSHLDCELGFSFRFFRLDRRVHRGSGSADEAFPDALADETDDPRASL